MDFGLSVIDRMMSTEYISPTSASLSEPNDVVDADGCLDTMESRDIQPVIVDLSEEGKALSDTNTGNALKTKASSMTSDREEWEITGARWKYNDKYDKFGQYKTDYLFFLDAPEAYARYEELSAIIGKGTTYIEGDWYTPEVRKKAIEERDAIDHEWFMKRGISLMQQFHKYNIKRGWKGDIINSLETKYTDTHDFSIKIYGNEGQDEIAGRLDRYAGISMWRYDSKFNMLITSDMLRLMMGSDPKEKSETLEKIDKAVKNMKEAEKEYGGNKEYLRFGVKFHTDGSVTYHANYKGCNDSYGISAKSADELLELLKRL